MFEFAGRVAMTELTLESLAKRVEELDNAIFDFDTAPKHNELE